MNVCCIYTNMSAMWWVKKTGGASKEDSTNKMKETLVAIQDNVNSENDRKSPVDIQEIIEKINKEASASPLGTYESNFENHSIEELIVEAKRIYEESSKSFDQLSQRSKTSQNISELFSSASNETSQRSLTPLPYNTPLSRDSYSNERSFDDKNNDVKSNGTDSEVEDIKSITDETRSKQSVSDLDELIDVDVDKEPDLGHNEEIRVDNTDLVENHALRKEIHNLKEELEKARQLLSLAEHDGKELASPQLNNKLQKCLEDLKETEEHKTFLQLQLEESSRNYKDLKISHESLVTVNETLEKRVHELDALLNRHKGELTKLQERENALRENEDSLKRALEHEKQLTKSLKMQAEKDAKCILDLNRQIKEMERIMSRKNPDTVSTLIMPMSTDKLVDTSSKKILEERIHALQQKVIEKDNHSSKVLFDIQEKFMLMKSKYESHIQDLELHVSDLKAQLKHKKDTYDVYSQTCDEHEEIPKRSTSTVGVQTNQQKNNFPRRHAVSVNKTNRNAIRSSSESRKEITPSELNRTLNYRKSSLHTSAETEGASVIRDIVLELQSVRNEKDKILEHLRKLEDDYQILKNKRLNDLNILQEAHEREMQSYLANVSYLHEQIAVQQTTISTLQAQLTTLQTELSVMTLERDRLNKCYIDTLATKDTNAGDHELLSLRQQLAELQKRYEEREHRLQGIVQELAQRNIRNVNCDQCSKRQQQIIEYKLELEKLLATLRTLQ